MHDPMTVAHEIRYPWRKYSRGVREASKSKFDREYRESFMTVWHVDPERDGSDDSCGWFKRPRHGNQEMREQIRRAFAGEWDGEHLGWFDAATGMPRLSVQATTLGLFRRAAYIYHGDSWAKTDRFLRRHLLAIITFAENTVDSFHETLTQKYGPEPRERRIQHATDVVYGCILRWSQPWWQHPRWHVHHWRFQVHPLQQFKRWAFSRCAGCGRRFTWGYSPTSTSWNGTGPRWFRGETNVYHSDCHVWPSHAPTIA